MAIFTKNELDNIENELKAKAKSESDQRNNMEELRKQSISRVMRTFDLYIEAAKEYVASANRFGIVAKPHEYQKGVTLFTSKPILRYSKPVFDIGLKNYPSGRNKIQEICMLPSGEVYVEESENCWDIFNQEHKQSLMEAIEERSYKEETWRYSLGPNDIIDTLRLLTYNHSEERYDFDGGYLSSIYLDKPRSEEEIKEEIKKIFLTFIRENQGISNKQ